jgi:hypothetical protein
VVKKYYTLESFKEEIERRFPDKYDLSGLTEFKNQNTTVEVRCKKHGTIRVKGSTLLRGFGCKKCRYDKASKSLKHTFNTFIQDANVVHNNKYLYDAAEYVNKSTKIKIICPIHGPFYQTPHMHLRGVGCPKCGALKRGKSRRLTKEVFISRATTKHNNFYDYTLVDYKTTTTKVKIICPIHGVFEQSPSNHLFGNGCPKCKQSKGEKSIKYFLDKNNISHTTQYKYKDCVYKKELPFDFAVLNKDGLVKFLIEYQGEQHFNKFRFINGDKNFETRQLRDKIKYNYCKEHNIPLYYITYKDNIEEKLKELPFDGD